MTTSITYENLALDWSPRGKGEYSFWGIVAACVIIIVVLGVVLSTIELPKEERKSRRAVPERIAQLVLEQKKQKPPPPPVKVEPKPKPKPPVKPKPRVKKEQEKKEEKPLTKEQKKAREKAQDTGLLALGNELADLIDTSDVDALVGRKVTNNSGSGKTAAKLDTGLLTENVGKGSGGVIAENYAGPKVVGSTLTNQETTAIRQSLVTKEPSENTDKSKSRTNAGNVRAEEEITLVFDQNKGKLYSIYNRERRRNPGLKGKIVLEITITPDGVVDAVNIISSELNNTKLERSLVARIKRFKFSAGKTGSVTITYPIEFLPS